jgi:hypothetical protein
MTNQWLSGHKKNQLGLSEEAYENVPQFKTEDYIILGEPPWVKTL